MHLPLLIHDLAVILGVAGVVTILFRKIRQPVVLGYLVAGIIIGPHTPPYAFVSDIPNIHVLAELGVIFLMFSLGLEFTFHKLVRVGPAATGTALIEVVGMLTIGYVTGQLLGWRNLDSLFLGGILSVSSTTIIIKAFDELNLRKRRFSDIVFGILIIEDLVAILLLVALSTLARTQQFVPSELAFATGKLLLVVGSWFLVGFFFIPRLLRSVGRWMDEETLTVVSIALCLVLVVIANSFNYSSALGAFIMGSILAETRESHRIENLIRPVRDLFGAVFFVSVGMLVDPSLVKAQAVPIAIITVVTIVGKIITSTLGAIVSGQPPKRALQIGFSLAQIGEFSFIIATLGTSLGVIRSELYPIAVTVSLITTFLTPYLIKVSEPCAVMIERALPVKVMSVLLRYAHWKENPKPPGFGFRWFDRLVLKNLKSAKPDELAQAMEALAPWDLHLVQILVHANSEIAGKKISESAIRRRFGLNVVIIRRGSEAIASPSAEERILPADELLVLGTDEQIEGFRTVTEVAAPLESPEVPFGAYGLKRVLVSPASPFVGMSIRSSGIRESLKGLVVGMERRSFRTINPDPALILENGDILWVVNRFDEG